MIQPIVNLLALANAGEYTGKREYFYPFKDRFLRRYGEQDGYDLQQIQKACWQCDGTGKYVSRCQKCRYEGGCYRCEWFEEDFDDEYGRKNGYCFKCGGSGWYVNKTIWLERWRIGGRVFHIPTVAEKLPFLCPPPANVYEGVIKHPPADNYKARRAAALLIALFDLGIAFKWCQEIARNYWRRYVAWPVRSAWNRWKYGDVPF